MSSQYRVTQSLLFTGFLFVLTAAKSLPRIADEDVPEVDRAKENGVPFNLEETYNQSLRTYGFNGTWKTDKDILYTDNLTGNILLYDVTTRKSRLHFQRSGPYEQPVFTFSHDDSYVLIGYETTAGFRHSTYRKFAVYDTKRQNYEKIANSTHIPLARWSPTENALIYIYNNDIYYKKFGTVNEERRITDTGVNGVVYNGIPDWVYEEEVFGSASAYWFSPDGRYVAFGTFNDSGVKDATLLYYGEPGSFEYQYPMEVKIKYPKAGTPNPIVSLSIVDLSNPSSKLVNLAAPTDVVGADHVLYTVNWWNSSVVATWTNRVQNKAQTVLYGTQGAPTKLLYTEEREGWLRISPPNYHGEYMIVAKLQDGGTEAGQFLHITRFAYRNGTLVDETDLTPGASEVQSILTIDSVRGRIYYLATGVGEPSQRNLYYVGLNDGRKPVCISCGVITPEGHSCTYASATFSKRKSFYALSCSGPDPTTVAIFDAEGRQLFSWEGNQVLRKKLAARTQPLVKNLQVRANGYDCRVRLLLPPNFDEKNSYPLLINVYAGPNTVRITDAASYGFHSYMTTNRSVIYGFIDGRGSAYKGSKMLHEIYRRMGTVEVQDQVAVTHILQKTYPWIDANHTAIWGWSYGGFATAMALAIDDDSVFKCGISVAPVSSWIYYDSIYTERIMGLPTEDDNLAGYNMTDVTRLVEGIRGKKLMLIHGTGDDNVHFQQAMALSKALVDKDILFEQMSYTDEAHGLTGVSPHLYHTMDKFWEECLGLAETH